MDQNQGNILQITPKRIVFYPIGSLFHCANVKNGLPFSKKTHKRKSIFDPKYHLLKCLCILFNGIERLQTKKNLLKREQTLVKLYVLPNDATNR